MHAIWVSLKETANCRVKLTNVVSRAGTCGNRSEKDILEREPAHCTATPIRKAIFGQTRTLLYGLNTGDPSRNIVELIFQRASTNPSKPSRKIKTVLKVKNSIEILDRFEEYREKVKKKAYERYKRNPRSTVDGNELLRFYGSTMVCYSGKSKRVSELCKDPTCEVCRIIESNFDTDRTRRYGVRLSTGSDDSSENMIAMKVLFGDYRSEGGLFIDMNTFLAFGKDCVGWNYEKTGNPVYLHLKQIRKAVPEDRPSKKPTLLAIGVDGGFDNSESEYGETLTIVILPNYVTLPFPSVELPEKVRLAVDAILMAEGAERKEQVAAWIADKKQTSPYAVNLLQIDNGVIIPPSGWKCAKCDKKDNLWLNLTNGMVLCGRRNWDGTGGNNHAIEHYKETGYPLAVKLGTITADLEAADVFSYPEDESVLDPLLAEHLAHFGIDFSSLQKTEMTTAERELDQNTNFDWNRIQESGQEVEPLCGPGYTGLVNLGNSCYLAATMQVVCSTRSFCSRYYMTQSLKMAFEMAPADPTVDLNMQLTKLSHGLLSGKYSIPALEKDDNANATSTTTAKQEGIPPRMFKAVIAASHPEFSTMRQQDALEFFLHFLDQVERANAVNPELDPARSFKFGIEDRILCSSGKVTYHRRLDYILSLNIPLHEATNKEDLEAFQKFKAEKISEGKEVSSDEIVRPRVPLEACLASFSAPEEIHEFYSTALKAKTMAVKTAGLTSFPDYLVLHMRKFVMEAGWVPKKLDVYIDVPDIIDISHMRSKGLQPGEELLPDGVPEGDIETNKPLPDEDIVSQLVSMGFNHLHCEKAAVRTSNTGVEEAMNWLLSHMDDPDIDVPISQEAEGAEALSLDQSKVDTLISFGFQEEIARKALKVSGGDIEKATDWIFSNPEPSASLDLDATTSNTAPTPTGAGLPDGGGRYRLIGIVSHIGTSTQCGHYVAHIFKEGRWVIYNDDKVGASVNPPKDMGYLYFFERLNS